MIRHTSTWGFLILIILIIAAVAGSFWLNLNFTSFEIGGTDFYVNWFGTRALIIDGVSPYSESVESELRDFLSEKTTFYHAEGSIPSTPLYAIIITLPFALIEDFNFAWALWSTSQQIAIPILILVMLHITKWRPKLVEFAILFLGILISHFAISAYISGNMIIWTSTLLVLGLSALSIKRDEIAGAMLALTTVQPQVYFLTLIFILLWAVVNRRRLLLVWFFGMLFILIMIGIILIPGWLVQYVRILTKFAEHFPYVYARNLMTEQWPGIGVQLSWVITLLIAIILIIEWWQARSKDYRWFIWTVCLTLVMTRLIGIPVHFQHNFVLFIPLILVLSVLNEHWQRSGRGLIILIIFIIFSAGWLQLFDNILVQTTPSQSTLIYPLPIFLLVTLYWVRWWAIRPSRLYIQEMLSRG